MPLDPQAANVLELLEVAGLPDPRSLPTAEFRALSNVSQGVSVELAKVEDRTVPGPAGEIPVRVYRPETAAPLPTLVYFHGGGFVICGLESHDGTCRQLAQSAGCAVVSVDYRLAPEHRFPAAPEDCYAATRWVAEHGPEIGVDGSRLAVGGDSAGGNLAAVTALMARDRRGPPLRHQLLVYPVTDFAFETPSYEENAEGYLLTRDMMEWFWEQYLAREADGSETYASPIRAENLGGLPPAHLITAEYDPLRDEGDRYAERLREAGVPVLHRRHEGVIHGFFSMFEAIDEGRRAIEEAAGALRKAFA